MTCYIPPDQTRPGAVQLGALRAGGKAPEPNKVKYKMLDILSNDTNEIPE